MTRMWTSILGYGLLAAAVLACLFVLGLAMPRLALGRELVGAAIALIAVTVGLRLADRARPAPPADAAAPPPPVDDAPCLSARERQILALLAEGRSNKEMARALGVSENTVKTHLGNLYGKLAVRRRTEALAAARRLRLLSGA